MARTPILLGLLAGVASACAPSRVHVESAGKRLAARPFAVAVAPARLLADPDAGEPAATGTFVGSLHFEGGYEPVPGALGTQNTSRSVTTDGSDAIGSGATRAVDDALREAIAARRWRQVPWSDGMSTAPTRTDRRGTHPEDGTDDVPLPRFDLSPVPRIADLPTDVDMAITPWIARWYVHNAGWFPGQTYGSAAGARVRVWVGAWDARTGEVLAWTDLDVRVRDPELFQPNQAQLEDLLIEAEDALARQLRRQLFR